MRKVSANGVQYEGDAGTPARQRYYVWGNYIDELLLLNDDAGDDSDYFVCHDQLYSSSALLDSSGAIVETYYRNAQGGGGRIYTGNGGDGDWWDGDETTGASSAKGLPYLWTGRERDQLGNNTLGLYYFRARYYRPEYMRFLQRDPEEYVDGMNLYEYAKSRPTVLSDPYGRYVAYSACSSSQINKIKGDAAYALRRISQVLREVNHALYRSTVQFWQFPRGTALRLAIARSRLNIARIVIRSGIAYCRTKEHRNCIKEGTMTPWAYAYPWRPAVYLCPPYFDDKWYSGLMGYSSYRAGILVHEGAHVSGATDACDAKGVGCAYYGFNKCPARNHNGVGWQHLADTYRVWANSETGVCIPGCGNLTCGGYGCLITCLWALN